MPIEIRELVIKAVVEPNTENVSAPTQRSKKDKEKVVEESVDQTLKILAKKRER